MPPERDDFLEDLLHGLESYPTEKRIKALETCFSSALNLMDRETIFAVRAQVLARLGEGPERRSVIHLIDGHLALRDIVRTA
jgi:hypothetical protein